MQNDRVLFINREKNTQTLLSLGLTLNDVYRELLNLEVNDYYFGPEGDRDGSQGSVWAFLHPITGCLIYIKIKIFYSDDNTEWLKVLSYHESEQ